MATTVYAAEPEEMRTFTPGRKWFSENDDKAWAEKFYLIFIPIFFGYNALVQGMGWLDVGDFWHIVQNVIMWAPYCVVLPLILRRNHPLPFYKQWWFKFQVYIAVLVFFVTYFHTEYFFDVLGMRYNFPHVTLYFDSVLLGPDQATALANHKRIPLGIYINTLAFFTVYHIAAIVVIRRLFNMSQGMGATARRLTFVAAVAATAFFFAWAETFFYMTAPAHDNVWYIDLHQQLYVGSFFYAMYFIFTFPNVYRLDEDHDHAPWTLPRLFIEPAAMAMFVLLAEDLWTMFSGAPFA